MIYSYKGGTCIIMKKKLCKKNELLIDGKSHKSSQF